MLVVISFIGYLTMTKQAHVIGMGSYLPSKILSNHDLEDLVDTTDEWITSRTGIHERRVAAVGEETSDMGVAASLKALDNAQIAKEAIDLILVATATPDFLVTSCAGIIQQKLGLSVPAVDIQAACSGFLYALSMAKAYVASGMYTHVLVVATEKMSAFTDYTDRSTCILFGDGAASAVISSEKRGLCIQDIVLGADGKGSELIYMPAGGSKRPASTITCEKREHYFKMEGREVFKHAVRRMNQVAAECMERCGLQTDEISWLIPHQANLRILTAMAKQFSIPQERVYKTVHKYGNTSASSVLIALDELLQENPGKPGDHYLLVTFGAGLTWGASILTKAGES